MESNKKTDELKPEWWIKATERLPQHQVMCHIKIHRDEKPYIGYYDYSLKRFMCPNLGPQGQKIDFVQWLDEAGILSLQSENQRLTKINEELVNLLYRIRRDIKIPAHSIIIEDINRLLK